MIRLLAEDLASLNKPGFKLSMVVPLIEREPGKKLARCWERAWISGVEVEIWCHTGGGWVMRKS